MRNAAWPTEIKLIRAENLLELTFDDGEIFRLSAEYLRVDSPSAEVKGHGSGQEVTIPGKRYVKITKLDPVGNYAIRIHFDDGHDTGLYSWEYLYTLGKDQAARWGKYLERLAAQGLDRDPFPDAPETDAKRPSSPRGDHGETAERIGRMKFEDG